MLLGWHLVRSGLCRFLLERSVGYLVELVGILDQGKLVLLWPALVPRSLLGYHSCGQILSCEVVVCGVLGDLGCSNGFSVPLLPHQNSSLVACGKILKNCRSRSNKWSWRNCGGLAFGILPTLIRFLRILSESGEFPSAFPWNGLRVICGFGFDAAVVVE